MTARHIAKTSVRFALHRLGGLSLLRQFRRGGVRILTYHAFSERFRPNLEQQCRHLKRHYRPVPLRAVADSLHGGPPLPSLALSVTVDDGYRNFLVHGWPIFRQYGIPVTVYLVSDFIDGRIWLWWNRLQYGFLNTELNRVTVSMSGQDRVFTLLSEKERRDAAEEVIEHLKLLPNIERVRRIEEILGVLDVRTPWPPPAAFEPLSWDEVRQLESEGVEFGAHTRTHPILSTVEDPLALREEVEGSRERIAKETGSAVVHFSYPNGSINDAVVRAVAGSGFLSAVTSRMGYNRTAGNPLLLERIPADPMLDLPYQTELISGFRQL